METPELKEKLDLYEYGVLDLRFTPEAQAINDQLFGPNTLGIEVTDLNFAKKCGLGNIDPQHTEGKKNLSAIEVAMAYPLPPDKAKFVTIRPDLDAFGSMAVLSLRRAGKNFSPEMLERVKLIADSDNFNRGDWPGSRLLPTVEKLYDNSVADVLEHSRLAPIARAVGDFTISIQQRAMWVKEWLENGEEPVGYREVWLDERRQVAEAIASGDITVELDKDHKIARVISKYPSATSLGYSVAPVVVAFNSEFKSGSEEPYKKFTIAEFQEGYVDIAACREELNKLEPGWGGTLTLLASPQGRSSMLSMEEVNEVVKKYLK